jgi:hypothetical protein
MTLTGNPLGGWARQIPCPNCYVVDTFNAALGLLVICAALAFGSACLALVVLWVCRIRRWPVAQTLVATFAIAAFIGGFLFEVSRLLELILSHDLTADDATGALLDEGAITLHGWETLLRRALLAGAAGGLMGGVFVLAGRLEEAGPATHVR